MCNCTVVVVIDIMFSLTKARRPYDEQEENERKNGNDTLWLVFVFCTIEHI